MTRSSLRAKVTQAIEQYAMLSDCRSVAVGLSGGADSTALFHCLWAMADELGVEVRAIHVNHCIRGAEADSDERHAARLCEQMAVKLDRFTVDVPAEARARGLGLEECGRVCRYECFNEVSARCGCRVATAHTLSDSAETLLFNLTRGCGIAGLGGIPAVRGNIIRPLILCTREEVEEYCAEQGLSYVTDSTNADSAYSRNRLRLEVIPALRRINPAFHESAARLMDCAAEDEAYLSAVAARALEEARQPHGWSAEGFSKLPPSIKRRAIIQLIAESTGRSAEYRHVRLAERYIAAGSGAVELTADCRLSVSDGCVTVGALPAAVEHSQWERPLAELLQIGEGESEKDACAKKKAAISLPDGRIVHLCVTEVVQYDESSKKPKLMFKNSLDYDIISDNSFLRFRREGDRFRPSGSEHTKRLKKLLCDSGVTREERERRLIVAQGDRLMWLEGFGVSEEARVRENTRRVLTIELEVPDDAQPEMNAEG